MALLVRAARRCGMTLAVKPSIGVRAGAPLSEMMARLSISTEATGETAETAKETVLKPPHRKLKIPTKRAKSLLIQLENEVVDKSLAAKDIDNFRPGDSVEVTYMLSRTSGKVQRVRGVVLARRNRGPGSSFIIRNHIAGYGYEQTIFLHTPLLQSVKILQPAFIHKGKKRVRRAKLFYLRDRAPSLTTV